MFNQKGMSTTVVAIIVVLLLLIGGGWYAISQNNAPSEKGDDAMMHEEGDSAMHDHDEDVMKEDDSMMSHEDEVMMEDKNVMIDSETSFKGAVIAGSSSPLLEYNQRDYEAAIASDRVVVLYFYANWCPLCKAEFVDTMASFDALTNANVVGFRIHFNDNDVTSEMEDLAREFGVAYQHTKVFIKNGERVLKSPETWDTERYLAEFANHIN